MSLLRFFPYKNETKLCSKGLIKNINLNNEATYTYLKVKDNQNRYN